MLRTIEAEITTDGTVTLLEPIELEMPARALVTVMENGSGTNANKGNVSAVLRLMRTPGFKNRRSYPADEIEMRIEEERNAW